MVWRILGVMLLGWFIQPAWAVAVPEPLQPWRDWVLQEEPQRDCPFWFADITQKQCAWPGRLSLTITSNTIHFNQSWTLYAKEDVPLPGSGSDWPMAVKLNGKPALVVDKRGMPVLSLEAGHYQIEGSIPFIRLPDSLQIPARTALIKLWRNNQLISRLQRDADGRLWLVERQTPVVEQDAASEDQLTLRVFRKLRDEVPFRVQSRVELEVSGKPREMVLGKFLFDGFVPENFNSPLPARIEPDGRLRIQLRPGRWWVEMTARRTAPVTQLRLETAADAIWAEEEIWAFEERPDLRQVRIEGGESVDPQQVRLPAQWKMLPAWRVLPNTAMTFTELRRGDPQPAPNRITLKRELWLDFDGQGLTSQDRLSGTMNRDWRLTANSQQLLGRLELNGEPQVITLLEGTPGVEIRQGALQATAMSRLANEGSLHHRTLSATGWQQDADHLQLRLQLAPGWRLLGVTGVDSASNTWLGSWNVWDVFIVLVAVVAVWRLRGRLAGVVSALAFLLIYPESAEFLYLWLNLIAVMALLLLLPAGTLRRAGHLYATLSALLLAVWLLQFMVEQARLGLYPQLHQPWLEMGYQEDYRSDVADGFAQPVEVAAMAASRMQTEAAPPRVGLSLSVAGSVASKKSEMEIIRVDPNLAAQTGPGQPGWQWTFSDLRWNGPVTQAETFDLYLLTPWENRLLAWLRVLLGLLMLVAVVGVQKNQGRWQLTPWRARKVAPAMAALLLCVGLSGYGPEARADLPSADMLQELKQRLLQQKDCTPGCLGIERLHIDLTGQRLTLRFTVNSRETLYWPLPGSQQQWQIDAALLNGETVALRQPEQQGGHLQVAVPAGQHQLQLSGSVPATGFQLTFPVAPHNLQVQADGWTLRGLDNGRLQGDGLYFEPLATPDLAAEALEQQPLKPDPVPPFVVVQRNLQLGLDWYLRTTIQRVAPAQGGITLELPLLAGEAVTSQGVRVEGNKVLVQLRPDERETGWTSTLARQPQLTLQADKKGQWAELWTLDASPLWHVTAKGIAPAKEPGDVAAWRPRWQPYSGEQLELIIQRPEALAGATSTIDRVQQTMTPGQKESRHQLRFHVMTSKGAEQSIDLASDARVIRLLVDGESRALDEAQTRVMVPLAPGQHWVELEWREPAESGLKVKTPLVNLNTDYVNHSIRIEMPKRWLLFAGGPMMGPVILFWGVLIVTLLVAIGLGRLRQLPVKTVHWVLLVVGLCASAIELLIPLALWFLLMNWRRQFDPQQISKARFNLLQTGLVLFTVMVFLGLAGVIPAGLLGSPDMGITGNGSSAHQLNWFVDRGSQDLSQAWFVAVPLWVYRTLMLVWSLWLAFLLPGWLKWGWQAFVHGGYWRKDRIQTGLEVKTEEELKVNP